MSFLSWPNVSKAFDSYWNAPASMPVGALTGRLGAAANLGSLRMTLAQFVEAQQGTVGKVQHRNEPEVSAWRQLGIWFLGLLPIESQL
jgi:hypothetical protein